MVFEDVTSFVSLNEQFTITFLFSLAIIFGVLEFVPVFRGNRAVNVIIALALSYFASTYPPFVTMLWGYLPSITWFFIAMFFVAFLFEIVRRGSGTDPVKHLLAIGAAFLVLLAVGFQVTKQFNLNLPFIGGGENIVFGFGLLFIIVLFWGAMNVKPVQEAQPQQKGGR